MSETIGNEQTTNNDTDQSVKNNNSTEQSMIKGESNKEKHNVAVAEYVSSVNDTPDDDGAIDDADEDVGIEPGELPSAIEGNADVGDMNVLEAILGGGDEAKDEFDKEIDANTNPKKPSTPAKTKKTTKSVGKRKSARIKPAKKTDVPANKEKPTSKSEDTSTVSSQQGQNESKVVPPVGSSDIKQSESRETNVASSAKKVNSKTSKKVKEKVVTTGTQEKKSEAVESVIQTAKSTVKVPKKKKAAVKSSVKKEPKKIEEAVMPPPDQPMEKIATVNDNAIEKKTKVKSPVAKIETKVVNKPNTKAKKEKTEKTVKAAVERKRKASDVPAGKEVKVKKGKDKAKVEVKSEDDAPVEEPAHEVALEVKAENDMQVVDDVDIALSDHGSHFSHESDFDNFSRSPSFTESLSGSLSVTLSSFSGSPSSLDAIERELGTIKKKKKKRKHTEGDENDSEKHKAFINSMLKGARYFIIKSNNHENVSLSKAKAVWATPPANERKLNDAYKHSTNVILVFSVKESGRFQGFARLASESRHDGIPVPWVLPPGFDRRILGGTFKVDWLNRKEVAFSKCANLRNPWNENKEVKICRDGQELEPSVGEVLCRMFEDDRTIDVERVDKHLKRQKSSSGAAGDSYRRGRDSYRRGGDPYRQERFDRYRGGSVGGFRGSEFRGDWRGGRGGGGFRGGFRTDRGRFVGRSRGAFQRGSSGPSRGRFNDNNRRRDKYEPRRSVENDSYHRRRSRSPEYRRSDRESRDRRHKDRVKEFLKEDRSKYGIREETLLHGSYSDYVREFQRQKELGTRSSSNYYQSSSSSSYHNLPSSSSRHHSYDVNAASAEEFLRRSSRR